MKIKTYSEKGLCIIGATKEQAQEIARQLGAAVCTQHNPKLGGWVFSRKREDRIREIIAGMDDALPGKWGLLAS